MTDPDVLPVFDRRTTRRLQAVAVVLALGMVVVAVVVGTRAVRRATDVRQATELFQHVRGDGVTPGRSLTDPEFDRAVALLDSPTREARSVAAQTAGESADSPARRDRLTDFARRKVAGDPDDRHTALLLATILNLAERHDWAAAMRTDPDPGVRAMADGGPAHSKATLNPRGAADAGP